MKKRRRSTKQTARTAHSGEPSFVFAADDHVRPENPACRMDNYEETVFKKLQFRNSIAKKYNIPILIAGDLGEKSYFVKSGLGWTASLYNRFSRTMKQVRTLCCAGNHDILNHDMANINDSVIGSLIDSKIVELLNEDITEINGCDVYGCSWDCEIPIPEKDDFVDNKRILLVHKMIINNLPLWVGQVAPKATDILKQYPDYDLIVSGDNHQTFTAEYDGRILVNAGSMMRSTTKQYDHKPCFFLYYPESHSVEKIFYPIEDSEKVMSLKHIETKNKNSERVEKYANLVNKADLSDLKTFKENTEIFISNTTLKPDVVNLIRRFVNHEQPVQ